MGHLPAILGTAAVLVLALAARTSDTWSHSDPHSLTLFLELSALAYLAIIIVLRGLERGEARDSQNNLYRHYPIENLSASQTKQQ